MAEAGEVEAERPDAAGSEGARDSAGRRDVLRAGEAVCEDRKGFGLGRGSVEAGGQSVAVEALELDALGSEVNRHGIESRRRETRTARHSDWEGARRLEVKAG